MCEYCEESFWNTKAYEENGNRIYINREFFDADNNEFIPPYMLITTPEGERLKFHIVACLMCGRKLKEEPCE